MDPISGGLMLAGLGFKLFGMSESMSASKEYNAAQQQAIQAQMAEDQTRQKQNHVMADRLKLENLRRAQQASALATTNASAQGALQSSSIQTGRSQIRSQAGYNEQGVNTNLMFSDQLFAFEGQENQAKIRMGNAQMGMQEGNAFNAFGSDLLGSMTPFGRLFSGPSKG